MRECLDLGVRLLRLLMMEEVTSIWDSIKVVISKVLINLVSPLRTNDRVKFSPKSPRRHLNRIHLMRTLAHQFFSSSGCGDIPIESTLEIPLFHIGIHSGPAVCLIERRGVTRPVIEKVPKVCLTGLAAGSYKISSPGLLVE